MKEKCSECRFCKTYVDNSTGQKMFVMTCTKNAPNTTVVDLYEGKINEKEWKNLECCMELLK